MCYTFEKSKREFYQNLSVENIYDNKKIWKVVKPLLPNDILPSEKITLVERTKILKNAKVNNKDNAKETAKVLNNFFSTIIQNLKIPQYKEQYPISASISDPAMRTNVKYRAHPSIIATKENCNSSTRLNFSFADKEDILKETKKIESE